MKPALLVLVGSTGLAAAGPVSEGLMKVSRDYLCKAYNLSDDQDGETCPMKLTACGIEKFGDISAVIKYLSRRQRNGLQDNICDEFGVSNEADNDICYEEINDCSKDKMISHDDLAKCFQLREIEKNKADLCVFWGITASGEPGNDACDQTVQDCIKKGYNTYFDLVGCPIEEKNNAVQTQKASS